VEVVDPDLGHTTFHDADAESAYALALLAFT
jgi:hypothetical protein